MISALAQIKHLVWLKVRLTYRQYLRSRLALIGLFLYIGLMGFISFAALFFCLLLFQVMGEPQRTELLYVLLAAIYLLWMISPLFGVNLNESYDISKLFVYPIPYARLFAGSILGHLLDPPVILLAPALTSAVVGFGSTLWRALFICVVLMIFVFHTVSLSQILQLSMWGLLRSRRVRDFVLVFGSLFGVALYLGQFYFFRRMSFQTVSYIGVLYEARASKWLQLLPCGVAAKSITHAGAGQWSMALTSFVVLAGISLLTICAAGFLVKLFHAGEMEFGGILPMRRRPIEKKAPIRRRRAIRLAPLRWLPPEIGAITAKEFRYLLRDPQWKAYVIRSLAPTVFYPMIMVATLPGREGWRHLSTESLEAAFFIVPAATLLLSALMLNSNIFAIDREGLNLLFQFSCPRRSIILGKNLATYSLLGGLTVLILGIVATLTRNLQMFAYTTLGTLCLILLFLGSGNIISVFFPYRLPSPGQNPVQTSGGRGCLNMIINMLAYFASAIAAIPPVLALVLPHTMSFRSAYLFTIPTVVAYCIAIYALCVGIASRQLLRREAEIIRMIRAEE